MEKGKSKIMKISKVWVLNPSLLVEEMPAGGKESSMNHPVGKWEVRLSVSVHGKTNYWFEEHIKYTPNILPSLSKVPGGRQFR